MADGRRVRGDLTRRTVARRAAMIATVSGLDAITVGGLAADTGLSKSGILTVFPNREAIQLAAVAEARQIYLETVIRPAWGATPGRERLLAVLDQWVAYVRAETFPGGCFLASTSVEFGHREGPVADAVRALKREWLDLLERELASAGAADPQEAAFQIDAYLDAANAHLQLFGDHSALERARRLAEAVVPAGTEATHSRNI
jgi:AcrR family transcriptional regulator